MAIVSQIDKRAHEKGVDPIQMVNETLKRTGSIYRAAIELGVVPNTLRSWAECRGLKIAIRVERSIGLEPAER